jgi:hypothetical protein
MRVGLLRPAGDPRSGADNSDNDNDADYNDSDH